MASEDTGSIGKFLMRISRKHFLLGAFIGLILLIAYIVTLPDGKLHIVYCNVGQGDASFIRTPSNQDMLIDGGPNEEVLSCLGRHMPFYDRTIDVVLLTHPQKDHLQGLISVVQRYNVKYFVIGVEGNNTEGYKRLIQVLREKKVPVQNLFTGDSFTMGKVKFDVLWPERKWVIAKMKPASPAGRQFNNLTMNQLNMNGSAILGLSTDQNVNNFSYYLDLHYGKFQALFTGDGDSQIQPEVAAAVSLPDVDILKYPHHGSKTGMLPEFLDKIKPELAVISVGENSYGHPSKEALELLSSRAIKIDRTDKGGDVEIISDGEKWNEHR